MSNESKPESKAESKAESKTDSTPRFDPTQPFAFGFAMWERAAREQMNLVQSLWDEIAEIEGEAYRRVRTTAAQTGAMFDDSLAYVANLTAEWRKLALAAARKGNELFSSGSPARGSQA